MLKISNLRLPVDHTEQALRKKIGKMIAVSPEEIKEIQIVKQSIDARKKDQIQMVYTVQIRVPHENQVAKRFSKIVQKVERESYAFPQIRRCSNIKPVVVGMGPAGLFCALYLARNGIPCVLVERGKTVEERAEDVESFWRTGVLNPESNVLFGEGGAGTFSDGKLTTGTHDGRITAVLHSFVEAGAPEDIEYSHKPHIGSDVLRVVVRNIRQELLKLGCEICFETEMIGLVQRFGGLAGIKVKGPEGEYVIPADVLVIAVGHSARDTFEMLHAEGLEMEQKPFAIGVRIEHRQSEISRAQYGEVWEKLPPSDYKLACHLPSGRSAFTFCVCPGGQVVASASEPRCLVTNGMSLRARDGENINGGFLVGVGPEDFGGTDPLAGVRFQRTWEEAAFELGGGNYCAPAQLVGDFLEGKASENAGAVEPTYRPGVTWTDLHKCLPDYVSGALKEALPIFDRKVHGFANSDAVLTGIETRSSSPLRIKRDVNLQASMTGIYPCGEGCGYAGGIVSAAVDGIRVAEAIAQWKE